MTLPSLKKNAFALIAMQTINYLVPLVTLPYLTHTLGVSQYGAFNIALSLIQYGVLFVTFGFNLSTSQYIAQNRHFHHLISEIFWDTIYAKLLLLCVCCILLLGAVTLIDQFHDIRWIVFILFLQLIATTIDPLWFFQGIEKLAKISIYDAVIKIFNIPLLLCFVHSPEDIYKAAFIQAVIFLIIACLNLLLTYQEKVVSFTKYSFERSRLLISASLPYFVGTISVSLYSLSTPIILGFFSNYTEVGIYSASFKIQGAVLGIFTVLGQVLYPRVNYLFSRDRMLGYQFVWKLLYLTFPIVIILSLSFYFLVPMLSIMLLGNDFSQVQTTLRIMTPMIFVVPYAIIFSHYLLLPLGFHKVFYLTPLCIGLCHLVYSSFMSLNFGAIGASWSIAITDILLCLIYTVFVCCKTDLLKFIKRKV